MPDTKEYDAGRGAFDEVLANAATTRCRDGGGAIRRAGTPATHFGFYVSVAVFDCEVRGFVRQRKTVHPEGVGEGANSPQSSRIPVGLPVSIAPCPLNHRLISVTPSGVDEQALRNCCGTEIPSHTQPWIDARFD